MTLQPEHQIWVARCRPQPSSHSSAYIPLHRFWLRSLLVQSLSWIGALSLLSGNLVLAQTSPSADAVVLPTVKDLKSPTAAPDKPERLMQKLSLTSKPVRQKLQLQVSTPPAPQVSAPQVRPVQAKPTQLLEKTAINHRATDYSNAYIDPTKYSIGATSGYEAPSRVVLSERSTGCKAVLRQGQGVRGSICGTASQRRTRVAVRGIASLNSVRLTRTQAPRWARKNRAVVARGITPVRVGPISVSASGFRANSRPPVRGQVASVKGLSKGGVVYYNSTLQPTGQPGNTSTELQFPLSIPATITSLFGLRIHPITGHHRFHTGTDLGAPLGTPVLAAYTGNVALADFLGGYGLTVVLDHNNYSQQTLYGHLSEILVQPGEWVEQGSVIGRVGSTGNSTGPHLHFETRQLTPEGWVATDSGAELESALAQVVEALRTAQASQRPGA